MGNFFTKEIICDECTKQNIQPEYFEKQVICKTEDRDPTILIGDVPIIVRIDKYGKVLSDKPSKDIIGSYITKCTCSNNHVLNHKKIFYKS